MPSQCDGGWRPCHHVLDNLSVRRGGKPMRDADILYKAVLALADREMKAKVMTPPEIAEALVLALAKVIEAAPDENHRNALRAKIHQHLERIEKGDRGLH
jgi:hypothetical protein